MVHDDDYNWVDLRPYRVPKEQEDDAWLIETSIYHLGRYCSRFQSALALCQDYLEKTRERRSFSDPWFEWGNIATNDAALTVYHFGMTIRTIQDAVARIPAIRDKIDLKALRDARKNVARHFPGYEDLRDAIAHQGDIGGKKDHVQRHSISGEANVQGIIKMTNSSGILTASTANTFTTTFKGKILSITLDEAGLQRLNEVCRQVRDIFGGFH